MTTLRGTGRIGRACGILGLWALAASLSPARAGESIRVETFERDGVRLTMRVRPERITLAQDLEVTLDLSHPESLEVHLPEDFSDRFEGFRLEGSYEDEAWVSGGMRHRMVHLRARPLPVAERYRLAPFAVRIHDPARPDRERWFPTRALSFPAAPLLEPGETPPENVEADLTPRWVRPPAREMGFWLLMFLGGGGAVAGLVLLLRFLRRRWIRARMAPRERALLELRELLGRNLPAKGQAKLFYLLLTRIVRRYVERRHAIRAPELTTDEFLREAARHPAFPAETLSRLHEFLDAADRVKFAGLEASDAMIDRSVATAREYLQKEPAHAGDVPREEVAR